MICVDILITYKHHTHLPSYSPWWLFVWCFGLPEMPLSHNTLSTWNKTHLVPKSPGCSPESNDSNSGKVRVMREYCCLILLPAFTLRHFQTCLISILSFYVIFYFFPPICMFFFPSHFPLDPLGYSYTSKCFMSPCDDCYLLISFIFLRILLFFNILSGDL